MTASEKNTLLDTVAYRFESGAWDDLDVMLLMRLSRSAVDAPALAGLTDQKIASVTDIRKKRAAACPQSRWQLRTWEEIQAFLACNGLLYRVERFNMSLRGALVGTVSNQVIAYTVKDAAAALRTEFPELCR